MTSLPFRIKIGITGHRNNLPEVTLLKKRIKEIVGLDEWNKNNKPTPNSIFSLFDNESLSQLSKVKNTPTTFSIMTALAEGADRIAAEAIHEIENSRVEAVLPLTKEDYLTDFTTVESKKQFEQLLQLDRFAVSLRNRNIEEEFSPLEALEARKDAYLNVGKYIVDNCDVMIAIWDGIDTKKKGGTSDIVNYSISKQRPIIIINSNDPDKIIIHKFAGLNAEPSKQIDFFNSYQTDTTEEEQYVVNVYNEYFDSEKLPESKVVNPELLKNLKEYLFPYYAKGSLIAKGNKKQYERTGLFAYLFSVLAVMVVLTAIVFHSFHQIAFIIEFILLLAILILISKAHRNRAHKNWLENRFLVERIRAAPYFFVAGKEIPELKISSGKSKDSRRSRWMVMAFSEIWYQLNKKAYDEHLDRPLFSKELAAYVRKSWVEGQLNFQKKYWQRNKRWNDNLERGGRTIFFAAIIAVVLHIILSFSGSENTLVVFAENLLTIFALSLPPIAAAFEGIRRQREYSRNTRRSENMIPVLEELKNKYETVDENNFPYLLKETDKLLLQENQDWMVLMISYELEYVT